MQLDSLGKRLQISVRWAIFGDIEMPLASNIVKFGLGLAAVACLFVRNNLFKVYAKAGYAQSDAISGHVVNVNNHGSISYITRAQHHSLLMLNVAGVSLFLIAVLIDLFSRDFFDRVLHLLKLR